MALSAAPGRNMNTTHCGQAQCRWLDRFIGRPPPLPFAGELTPAHCVYFEGEGAWKLVGLEQVARAGAARRAGALRALRYAAPELLLAELQEGVSWRISFARGALVL